MSTTAEFLDARPRLRPDAVIGAAQLRGPARIHQIRILGNGRSLEVGAKERFVLTRLDGTRSLAEIGEDYQHEYGVGLGAANWGQILGTLHRRGLMAGEAASLSGDTAASTPSPEAPSGGLLGQRIPVVRAPSAMLDRVLRWTRPAFSLWIAVPLVAAVLAMEGALLAQVDELARQTGRLLHHPGPLLLVGLLGWVAAALHELAHGVAARRHGVAVLELGIRWLPPLVMPYCRTGGYLHLPRRRAHVAIAGVGVLVELALLLPAFVAWWWAPDGALSDTLAGLLLFGSAHALLNLLPVPPLDGYKMLGHTLGMSDYARHSAAFVVLAVRRDPRVHTYPRWARVAYTGYAASAVVAGAGLFVLLLLAGHAWLDNWLWVSVALVAVAGLSAGTVLRLARRRAANARGPARAVGGRHKAAAKGASPAGATSGRHQTVAKDSSPGSATSATGGRHQAVANASSPGSATSATGATGGRHRASTPSEVDSRPAVAVTAPVVPARRGSGATKVPALDLAGIVKSYGGRCAVDDVSLSVGSGEFLGLLGPNGAGKTTLIEIAVGLRRPDQGTVAVLGAAPWPRSTSMLSRIGVQTQTAAFFVRLTAREHLRTVAALYGLGRAAADEALRLVGLEGQADTRAERLSGGEQQRLAIATALVHDPELIFLDEPTASLDPQARRELWSVLRSLHRAGRSVVYTTHHLDEAEALCDRVAIMSRGSVVALGAPYELIENAALPTRVVLPRTAVSPERVRTLPAVTSATLEGPSVVVETHDSAAVLAELGRLVGLHGVQTRTPTLEDVYLDCIGSELAS